jgi:hypothetical protein
MSPNDELAASKTRVDHDDIKVAEAHATSTAGAAAAHSCSSGYCRVNPERKCHRCKEGHNKPQDMVSTDADAGSASIQKLGSALEQIKLEHGKGLARAGTPHGKEFEAVALDKEAN